MGFPAFYCCVILPRPLLVLVHLLDLLRHSFSSSSSPSSFLNSPPPSINDAQSSPSILKHNLPVLPFSSHPHLHHPNVSDQDQDSLCSICLCPIQPSSPVRLLPHCSHPFHQGCVDKWLDQGHLTCPLCRSRLLL